MRDTKQVIVMRTHYPDSKGGLKTIAKGKMIAQGAHASMAFLTYPISRSIMEIENAAALAHPNPQKVLDCVGFTSKYTEAQRHWLTNSFAKVCLKVKTQEELEDLYQDSRDADLVAFMITDEGRTEFGGVKTKTCIAIGPDWCDKIDAVTAHLQLFN